MAISLARHSFSLLAAEVTDQPERALYYGERYECSGSVIQRVV